MQVILDEGFQFGLGAFETVAVIKKRPVFLKEHLERLQRAEEFLGIRQQTEEREVYAYLKAHPIEYGALKIAVSGENKLLLPRENHYTEEAWRKGFLVDFSEVRRNETSPFTYHKTMNYGDCILEKRRAAAAGLDERIFLNGRGEISEGTISNIFFVRAGRLFTPEVSCGLLPGIMRSYILEHYEVTETRIRPEELGAFEECFVTNSLMGMMPVLRLGERIFEKRETADRMRETYLREYITLPYHRIKEKSERVCHEKETADVMPLSSGAAGFSDGLRIEKGRR